MVGYGGSSAGSYLADPTSPIPSHCASIVATSTVRVNTKHGEIDGDHLGDQTLRGGFVLILANKKFSQSRSGQHTGEHTE